MQTSVDISAQQYIDVLDIMSKQLLLIDFVVHFRMFKTRILTYHTLKFAVFAWKITETIQ